MCAPAPEGCVSHTVFYFLQVTKQISLVHAVLQHLLKAVLYGCNILVVGHAVPGIIGLQNLHGHLAFTQQFPNENRDQILCSQRIFRYFRLEELFEALLQEIRYQPPLFGLKTPIYQKSHVNYSELLQLAKGWSNLASNRIIIWRLRK